MQLHSNKSWTSLPLWRTSQSAVRGKTDVLHNIWHVFWYRISFFLFCCLVRPDNALQDLFQRQFWNVHGTSSWTSRPEASASHTSPTFELLRAGMARHCWFQFVVFLFPVTFGILYCSYVIQFSAPTKKNKEIKQQYAINIHWHKHTLFSGGLFVFAEVVLHWEVACSPSAKRVQRNCLV